MWWFYYPAASDPEQTQTDGTEANEDTEEDNPEDPRSLSLSLSLSHTHTCTHTLKSPHAMPMESQEKFRIPRKISGKMLITPWLTLTKSFRAYPIRLLL